MSKFTFMISSGPATIRDVCVRRGIEDAAWPDGFMPGDSFHGHDVAIFIQSSLKKREIFSNERGLVKDEDCAPHISKAYLYDLADMMPRLWAMRGTQGAIDAMLDALSAIDVELETISAWPNDLAAWLCERHGFVASSYKLRDFPVADGRLLGSGTFRVEGGASAIDDVEAWTDRITVTSSRPRFSLSIEAPAALSFPDKRAGIVFERFVEFMESTRREDKDE